MAKKFTITLPPWLYLHYKYYFVDDMLEEKKGDTVDGMIQ